MTRSTPKMNAENRVTPHRRVVDVPDLYGGPGLALTPTNRDRQIAALERRMFGDHDEIVARALSGVDGRADVAVDVDG